MHTQALQAITQYAKKIMSNSAPFPDTRYPPASTGYACLWDCGYEDSSTDKNPVHIGLNDEEIKSMWKIANDTRQNCYRLVAEGGSCFLTPPDDIEAMGAYMGKVKSSDLQGTFEQEVCGELVTESDKSAMDTPWFGIFGPLGGYVYAAIKHAKKGNDVLSTMPNFFSRYRENKYNRAYVCNKVQIQSSGNEMVDKVRAGLSFNDIQVVSRFSS